MAGTPRTSCGAASKTCTSAPSCDCCKHQHRNVCNISAYILLCIIMYNHIFCLNYSLQMRKTCRSKQQTLESSAFRTCNACRIQAGTQIRQATVRWVLNCSQSMQQHAHTSGGSLSRGIEITLKFRVRCSSSSSMAATFPHLQHHPRSSWCHADYVWQNCAMQTMQHSLRGW